MMMKVLGLGMAASLFIAANAFAEAQSIPKDNNVAPAQAAGAPKVIKPYQSFITVQNYSLQNSGRAGNKIENVHLELTFPNGKKIVLPEGGQDWPIANGQMQPININYLLPYKFIEKDGFTFTVQIVRRGADLQPCVFKVEQLSEFNRSYVCHTDQAWQQSQRMSDDQMDKEAVQVRVSTDIKENLAGKAEGADVAAKVEEIPTQFITLQ